MNDRLDTIMQMQTQDVRAELLRFVFALHKAAYSAPQQANSDVINYLSNMVTNIAAVVLEDEVIGAAPKFNKNVS